MVFSVLLMVVADSLGLKMYTFGPKLGWLDCPVQPAPAVLTVKLNVAELEAPVVSVAVTVTLPLLAAVGVPEIRPEELMDSPAGNPVALNVSVCPDAESVAWTCRLTAVPTVQDWAPGLVTVTVLAPAGFTVQLNVAEPDAPVVSLAVTVTVEVPAVVGVPEISPDEELIDSPAGSPVAV